MLKKWSDSHILYLGILLVLTLIYLHNIIPPGKIMDNIHYINDVTFISTNLKESLFDYGEPHLWTPYYYSGRPLFAQPEYYFLDLVFLFLVLSRDIYLSMNLAAISYFFLAGVGMYLLFLVFSDYKPGALVAAIIYMFNGYMHSFVIKGNLNVLAGYALIPFAFYFFVKALKTKKFLENSLYSAIFIALQFQAGGSIFIPYELVLFAIYSWIHFLGPHMKNRAIKIIIVLAIIGAISFGLSAIKLLPGWEFLEQSNRGGGVGYQEYLGDPVPIGSFFYALVTTLFSSLGVSAALGIMGMVLLIFGLREYKKNYVLFSVVIIVLSLLMATESFVTKFLFTVPVFNQLRHVERALFMFAFVGAILAGVGLKGFLETIRTKINTKESLLIIGIIGVILLELLVMSRFPPGTEVIQPEEIPINVKIAEDESYFRTINLGLSDLVGGSGYNYLAQQGIGTVKGGSGIWFNEYVRYLATAQQTDPVKLWGILNNKYLISKDELTLDNVELIGVFDECRECAVWNAFGPYLYENKEVMPRAYSHEAAIVLIGEQEAQRQIAYNLLVDPNYDPRQFSIIHGQQSVSLYSEEELQLYGALILLTQLSGLEVQMLERYVEQGGIIVPDIFNEENTINDNGINRIIANVEGPIQEIPIMAYESNKIIYDVSDAQGFLIMSERFSQFDGWNIEGKKITRANGIISAIPLAGEQTIEAMYRPAAYEQGALFSSTTAAVVVVLLIGIHFRKWWLSSKSI